MFTFILRLRAIYMTRSSDMNRRQKDWGGDLINELESAYEAIAELPAVWPQFSKGFQRYILTRFPFAVIYRQSNEKIYVIAVCIKAESPVTGSIEL